MIFGKYYPIVKNNWEPEFNYYYPIVKNNWEPEDIYN